MFTHPALLRELTLTAELLRRNGEGAWARRLIQTADSVRKAGWTATGARALAELFEGRPSLEAVTFGAEHEGRIKAPGGAGELNERLSEHRSRLKELATQPLAAGIAGPRRRSPDLE